MFAKLSRYPLLPVLLLPLFFFLHGWNEQFGNLAPRDVWPLLLAHLAVAILVFIILRIAYRNSAKASLATTVLMAVHFFFGAVQDFLHAQPAVDFLSRYAVLLPLIAIGILYLLFRLRKTVPGTRFNSFLTLLLLVLVVMEGFRLLVQEMGRTSPDGEVHTSVPARADHPDIYYIVADEYSSTRAIREAMGYDNTSMDSALTGLGFRVMPEMRSNYNFTPFSVASTLNMEHLDWIPDTASCTPEDYNRCAREIRDNKVCSTLMAHGYTVRNHSIFDLPGEPSPVGSTFIPTKGKLLMAQTLLMRLKKDLGHLILTGPLEIGVLSKDLIYGPGKTNDTLIARTIREAERKGTGPRFVYTHLYLPHPPFYVDSLGRPKDKATLQREMDHPTTEAYRQYLPHANARILELIRAIREKNDRPAVILLLSDHGFRGHGEPLPRDQYFMNYAAIRLPASTNDAFHVPASNINVFPELLDLLLGTKTPRRSDKNVFLVDKPNNDR